MRNIKYTLGLFIGVARNICKKSNVKSLKLKKKHEIKKLKK